MNKKKIAIIGGGCSGLFVANLLKDVYADVFLFEKNNKLGKKILASGNGKCNFTNIGDYFNKYNNIFANNIISKFDVRKTIETFENLGLIYKCDDQGRCYPVSECSSSVLDCLKSGLKNVHVCLDSLVKKIYKEKNKYKIVLNGKEELFDYVICCSGSAASNLGSSKAYAYLDSLNIKVDSLNASLVPIKVKENISLMKGCRVKCPVKLLKDNKLIYEEMGEILFREDSLSGIAIFNISSYINRNKGKYKIKLDLSCGMSKNDLFNYIINKKEYYPDVFKGFLNDKIAQYIMREFACEYSYANVNLIVERLCDLSFEVVCLYPLEDGQVCSGGVNLRQINENLEVNNCPGLYVAGELIDVDGVCGGYNMQFAWSSAGVIAQDIKKKLEGIKNEG